MSSLADAERGERSAVWFPAGSKVRFVKQAFPHVEDLTGRRVEVSARIGDYPTGAWGAESRDYHQFNGLWSFTQGLLRVTFDWHAMSPFLLVGAIAVGIVTYVASLVVGPTERSVDRSAPHVRAPRVELT